MKLSLRKLFKLDIDLTFSLEYEVFLNYEKEPVRVYSKEASRLEGPKGNGLYGPYSCSLGVRKDLLDIPLFLSDKEISKIKESKMIVFFTEHSSTLEPDNSLISSEVSVFEEGSWLISSGDEPSHFLIRGIFDSFEDAKKSKDNFNI